MYIRGCFNIMFFQDIKKVNDILRSVYSEHTQMGELHHRLQAFKSELDSKRILREQLFVRDDVRLLYYCTFMPLMTC